MVPTEAPAPSRGPRVVPGHVLRSEDHPARVLEPVAAVSDGAAGALAGVGALARFGLRLTRLAGSGARPVTAAVPLVRAAMGAAHGPGVALRVDGRDAEPEALARAGGTGDRLLVLLPAPGEDESVWSAGSETTGATYADRLAATLGWTPVQLRHDRRNGPATTGVVLAALLQRLVDAWPVPVRRIALVGHGAGGLVLRSAGGVRGLSGRPWPDLVTHVVALGTPTVGVGEPGPGGAVGRRLEQSLAGVVVVDDALLDVPVLEHARHVVVTRAGRLETPAGRLVGGVLGRGHHLGGRRVARDLFPTAERYEVSASGGPLTNHPEIHDALLDWLR